MMLMHNYATIWKKGDEKMPRIIPIRELRDTNRMSEMCHEIRRTSFYNRKMAMETWIS